MRYLHYLSIFCIILLWSSCREDFRTTANTSELEFSQDTLFLDTVFSNIGSSTRRFKVYNKSDDNIHIPSVELGRGVTSAYRLNVNGVAGKAFENVEILAKDSIYVFVETTVDITQNTTDDEFLYTDQIIFGGGGASQEVALVTLVKDAVFLFPERDSNGVVDKLSINGVDTQIDGRYLNDDELTMTNEKPYVIYGYMAVGDPNGDIAKILRIEAGARLHFHANSGLIIADNASLNVTGAFSMDTDKMEGEVVFEGDRLEPAFEDVPGQWGAILLTEGSENNKIEHATIKNAQIGILNESSTITGSPNLILNNVQIYNSSNVGLLNRFSTVRASNVVVNNSGQFSLLNQLGGDYIFTHCTFANYWNRGFRNTPAVFVDNTLQTEDGLLVADLQRSEFTNCIIYGNQPEELKFNSDDAAMFNFKFSNTLIRFEDTQGQFEGLSDYDFEDPMLYLNLVRNADPIFQNTSKNLLLIGEGTPAEGLGLESAALQFPIDLNGVNRVSNPDLGAYQSIVFPD